MPLRASAELSTLLIKEVNRFTRSSKKLYKGDVDALHRTRVSSRRIRELLPVLGLKAEITRKPWRRLRKLTRKLGAVRDLDVVLLTIQDLQRDRRYPQAALAALARVLTASRVDVRDRLTTNLPHAKLRRFTRRLRRIAKHLDEKGRAAGALHPGAARTASWVLEARAASRGDRARQALDAAGTVYAPERLHDVRSALKKLRYALEFRAALDRGRRGDMVRLRKAQEVLGSLHDRQLLIGHARDLQASTSPEDAAARRDLPRLIRLLEHDCRKLHARFLRSEPALMAIATAQRVSRRHAERSRLLAG